METVEEDFRRVSDADLWDFRIAARYQLLRYTRERLTQQLAASGASPAAVEYAQHIFDPNVLTLGFARRFATYKRPNLLLHDPERLVRLLTNPQYPVQLIIAGKAHPQDGAGQAMIQAWTRFISHPEVRPHVVFLSDYDMLLTEHLVRGVDVWLNTPRRPWEASGTSGMKVLVNGGLNLSELDGWWAEAYTPEVGWALGDGQEHEDEQTWDAIEAEALYNILEQEVIPAFYDRDDNGVPTAWVARMRESMARLTPRFSANRTVREYTERYYLPRAAAYQKRAAERGAWGKQVRQWQYNLAHHWTAMHLGTLHIESGDSHYTLRLPVYLGEIPPGAVRVELYADVSNGEGPLRHEMQRDRHLVGSMNGYVYKAQVPATRPVEDYTPRIIPQHPDATVPLEAPQILWRR
jgi:starch phosphorylase